MIRWGEYQETCDYDVWYLPIPNVFVLKMPGLRKLFYTCNHEDKFLEDEGIFVGFL
jgi:hypothetical protein